MKGQFTQDIDHQLLCTFTARLAKPSDPHTILLSVDIQNIAQSREAALQIKVFFLGDKSRRILTLALKVNSFTDKELSKDRLLPDDAYRFEVFVNAIDIPFSELQMALSCRVGGKNINRLLLVPLCPLRFSRFFTEAEAEKDDYSYTTGAEKVMPVDLPLFQGNAESACRALFPHCYLNVNNDYCGVLAFCTNDMLFRYEATPIKNQLKVRLYGLSLTGQNGTTILNTCILILLQNIQFLLNN
jgi:hypothetical protein